jgi:PAS domain S-box-containing protein
VEHSHDAIISATFDGVIFSWNPAAERVYGYSSNEANGRSLSIIIPPDKEEESQQILERIRRGEHIDNIETTRLRKDGALIHVSITTSPIKDASGKDHRRLGHLAGHHRTQTAEAALRESEENYRKLVELSPDGILILSEGKYVYLNSAALEILGARTTGQILGKAILDLVHPIATTSSGKTRKLLDAGRDVPLHELKLIRVDGLVVDVEATSIPFVYRGNPAFQVVVRNITERKRAEEALAPQRSQPARAQRIAHLGSWEWDRRTDTLTWSDETYRIFGLDRAESEMFQRIVFRLRPSRMTSNSSASAMDEALKSGRPYQRGPSHHPAQRRNQDRQRTGGDPSSTNRANPSACWAPCWTSPSASARKISAPPLPSWASGSVPPPRPPKPPASSPMRRTSFSAGTPAIFSFARRTCRVQNRLQHGFD